MILEKTPFSPALVELLLRKMRRSASSFRDTAYLRYETGRMAFGRGKSLRILISNGPETSDGVTDGIKRGFRHSIHRVEIGPLSPESFEQFDVVVPITVSELLQVHQWPNLLKRNPLPVPSRESIQLCHDKQALNQRLIDNGFEGYIPKVVPDPEPPYILKKRIGSFGDGCWIIRDRENEKRIGVQPDASSFYRQEIIHGSREFATLILFANGRIIKSLNIMYEFDSEIPIKGQDAWRFKAIRSCPYLELFTRMLASIGYQGLCCVNYKVAGGWPYLLEINPRLGSSLAPYFFSFIPALSACQPDPAEDEPVLYPPVLVGDGLQK